MKNLKRVQDLTDAAIDDVTSYLLDSTDDGQGFEAIPELDSVRSALQDIQDLLWQADVPSPALTAEDLRAAKSSLFSERSTLDEVIETATASVQPEDGAAVVTALLVYHNTLLEVLAKELEAAPSRDVKLTYSTEYTRPHLDALLGLIPTYFDGGIDPGETLKAMVSRGYVRTAGFEPNWHEQPTAKLSETGSYAYPKDPVLEPMLTVEALGQCFYLYDYGLAAYRSTPEATPEFCRLD